MSTIHDPRPMGGSAEASEASSIRIATATDASGAGSSPYRGAGDSAKCAVLAGNWWAVALRGVFAILFGLIAILAPGSAILSLILLFSAYMLVDGVVGNHFSGTSCKTDERWGLLLLEGLPTSRRGSLRSCGQGSRYRFRAAHGGLGADQRRAKGRRRV